MTAGAYTLEKTKNREQYQTNLSRILEPLKQLLAPFTVQLGSHGPGPSEQPTFTSLPATPLSLPSTSNVFPSTPSLPATPSVSTPPSIPLSQSLVSLPTDLVQELTSPSTEELLNLLPDTTNWKTLSFTSASLVYRLLCRKQGIPMDFEVFNGLRFQVVPIFVMDDPELRDLLGRAGHKCNTGCVFCECPLNQTVLGRGKEWPLFTIEDLVKWYVFFLIAL
jgi:hypothetical protein